MGVFYQPNGLLSGPVFHKNLHQPEPHNVLGLRRTCPPVATAAATDVVVVVVVAVVFW